MRSWEELADQANALLAQAYQWPAEFSEQLKNNLVLFDRLCIERLQSIISSPLSDEDKSCQIHDFFSMRWTMVVHTNLDYTYHPNFISNDFYVAVAAKIAAMTEENIIQILMPTVTTIVTGDQGLLTDQMNSLQLTHFLISSDQNALIPLDDLYGYVKLDTDFLFPVITAEDQFAAQNNRLLFPLTAQDRELLCQLTPESNEFFHLLKKNHLIRYQQKPSIGFALLELSAALLKSSKVGVGADFAANTAECAQPIIAFYHIWTALPVEIANRISAYQTRGARKMLRDFLLCLYAYTPGIELSDAQLSSVDPEIVPCTHMIGEQIKSIYKDNLDLQNIPIPGEEAAFQEDVLISNAVLNEVSDRCLRSLSNRQLIMNRKNEKIMSYLPFFQAFTDNFINPFQQKQKMLTIQAFINSLDDLKNALQILPARYWKHLLFLSLDNVNAFFVKSDDIQHDSVLFIVNMLAFINEDEWKNFFDLLHEVEYGFLLNSVSIGYLLNEFNESSWEQLVGAMRKYHGAILKSSADIADLFLEISLEKYRDIFKLFRSEITAVLRVPDDYVNLFQHSSRVTWSSFFSLFADEITGFVQNQQFLGKLLDTLSLDRRLYFLELLKLFHVSRECLIQNLPIILSRIDAEQWIQVFAIFQINPRQLPLDAPLLFRLLNEINVAMWPLLSVWLNPRIKEILQSPREIGSFLDKLSADQWDLFFATFYHVRPSFSANAFVACLSEISQEKRKHFVESMFPAAIASLNASFFADILNLLSPNHWSVLTAMISLRQVQCLVTATTDISLILKKIPVEKWPGLKQHFPNLFAIMLRSEADLIMVVRELPIDKIEPIIALFSDWVATHITHINFLNTICYHVRDDKVAQSIALSIASNIQPVSFNLDEILVAYNQLESMQKNNTFLIFEIVGKRKIMQYLQDCLPLTSTENLTIILTWSLLCDMFSDEASDFFKSPVSFAMVFHVVPPEAWPALSKVFAEMLGRVLNDCLFLRSILLFLPPENRMQFCAAVFPHFNPRSFSLELLSPVFSVLPAEDWKTFYSLCKTRHPILILRSMNDLFGLEKSHDATLFRNWFALIGIQIELTVSNSRDLARLFLHFSAEIWPEIAKICSNMVIEQCQKIDFLKNTLMEFQPNVRFHFLKSIAGFLNRLPINASIMNDILMILDPNCWEHFLTLFGSQQLSRIISDEFSLMLILHGAGNRRTELLALLKNHLKCVNCANPERLMDLLKNFSDCEVGLLDLFKTKLVDVLARYLNYFMVCENTHSPILDTKNKDIFNFLVDKFLPILLSKAYFASVLDCQDEDETKVVSRLHVRLDVFDETIRPHCSQILNVNYSKLQLIAKFMCELQCHEADNALTAENESVAACSRIYLKLVAHFGRDFFETLPKYVVNLQGREVSHLRTPLVPPGIRPNRVVLFPQRPTVASTEVVSVPSRLFAPSAEAPRAGGGAAVGRQSEFLESLFEG